MPSSKTVVIAAAGSRKTTFLVEEALSNSDKQTLITTFTIENLQQIRKYIVERKGFVPSNIKLVGWYTFLLQDCARPYRNYLYERRIKTISMVEGQSVPYAKRSDTGTFYFEDGDKIYTDKIADFACRCNEESGGAMIKRLEGVFDKIFIDEVQDLAGPDLKLLELLFKSQLEMLIVGDNRQATYFTNHSRTNRGKRGINIIELFQSWERAGLCVISERNECYRCIQPICDFADSLYPDMPKTISKVEADNNHSGIFFVRPSDVNTYYQKYSPIVLRYSKASNTLGLPAMNFGLSKGQSFDRVLIFPTKPIQKYLKTKDINDVGDVAKFYVALTRARQSVAIVCDEKSFDTKGFFQLDLFSLS